MGKGGIEIQKKKEEMNIEDNYALCHHCRKLLPKKIVGLLLDDIWVCDECFENLFGLWNRNHPEYPVRHRKI